MKTIQKFFSIKVSKNILAIFIFIFSLIALVPNISRLEQHGDEKMYVWRAYYYGQRIANLDFSGGTDSYLDPGFSPFSFWSWDQPFGCNIVYALAMAVTSSPPPSLPYSYDDVTLQGPETEIPVGTLYVTRFAAVLCAAFGLALISLQFGWKSFIPIILLLAFPSTRDSFSRAWAEGPLMLGFGLCAIAYRSKWFPVTLGIASAFKFTAFGLWPLMFINNSCGKEFRWRRLLSISVAMITVIFLTPTAWFNGGPVYIMFMIFQRIHTWYSQSKSIPTNNFIFFPERYAWPFELIVFLLISQFITNQLEKFRMKNNQQPKILP
ncbi:MAG: hypothetical protein KBG10_02380 [Anaerolineaceae bacterium]|nr:hypothetical protein [Anaerolineaceae bacterium]